MSLNKCQQKMSNNLRNEASPLLADEDQDTGDVSVESTRCKLQN